MSSIISHTLVHPYAQRIARREGLLGKQAAFDRRVEELILDQTSEAWQASMGEATEQIFQGKGKEGSIRHGALEWITEGKRKTVAGPILDNAVFPFHRAMINLPAEGFVRMPGISLIPMSVKMFQNRREGKPWFTDITNADEIAGQIIFSAIGMLIYALSADDEEDAFVTGALLDFDEAERKHRYHAGVAPPSSMRIWGKWVSYDKFDPIATPIAMVADVSTSIKRGDDPWEVAANLALSGGKQVTGKSFARPLQDLLRITEKGGIRKWWVNYASSHVSNLYQQVRRNYQEHVGYNPDPSVTKEILKRTELMETDPIYDAWGRMAENITRWTGIKVQDTKTFKGDRIFLKWNNKNPDRSAYPGKAGNTYKGKLDTDRRFESKQYSDFTRVAGTLAKDIVEEAISDEHAGNPDILTLKQAQYILRESREIVRQHWKDNGNFDINTEYLTYKIKVASIKNALKYRPMPQKTGDPLQNLEKEVAAWNEMQTAQDRYRESLRKIRK